MAKVKIIFFSCLFLLALTSCSKSPKNVLRVVASPTPHAEMLEFIAPELKKEGIQLEIITLTDYLLPNKLIDEKEADANFFQHIPFLELQKKEQDLSLEILGKVHLEPMGLYSQKFQKQDSLENKKVALPLDPSNEARALKLLADANFITLNPDGYESIQDIVSNPYNIKFVEIDAALLPRVFSDVDFAIIPTNFALQAGLNPSSDALILESCDSPYANILVSHPESEKKASLQLLLNALKSEKMQEFIQSNYKGAIVPAE